MRLAPVVAAGAPPTDGPPRRDRRGLVAAADWSAMGVGQVWRTGRQGPQAVAAPGPEADPVVLAANAAGALLRREDEAGAQRLAWVAAGGPSRLVASIAGLADSTAPEMVAVRQADPSGRAGVSWLVLPPPDDRAPPPLVVLPYPGLSYATAPDLRRPRRGGDLERAALLAGHGYAVLLPSLPADPTADGPADGLGARLAALVDAAVLAPRAAGRFDPQRVAVWGFSFGGYGALAAIAQTDRFRAAIAQSPISDLISKAGALSARTWAWPDAGPTSAWSSGWTEDLQGGMRAPPWREPARYLRNSPVLAAGRVRTPLLLEHGDLDPIPVGQSAEVFTALFRQGKDAQLIVYAGEGHVLASPGNIRDFYRRAFAFLDEQLKCGPPGARSRALARPSVRHPTRRP
jgi:dipeptidyl aminopeptidase/acylaminoacyl peptidase